MADINFNQIPKIPEIQKITYGEYEYQVNFGDTKVLFNDASKSYTHLMAVEKNDTLLRFQLPGVAPKKTLVTDNTLFYPSIFTNVDASYEVLQYRVKETIIIKDASAIHKFDYSTVEQNINASFQEDGSIIYKDQNENNLYTIEAPYAFDANNNEVEVYMTNQISGYTLEVVPNENTMYPIYLDPTVTMNTTAVYGWFTVSAATTGASDVAIKEIDLNTFDISSLTVSWMNVYSYYCKFTFIAVDDANAETTLAVLDKQSNLVINIPTTAKKLRIEGRWASYGSTSVYSGIKLNALTTKTKGFVYAASSYSSNFPTMTTYGTIEDSQVTNAYPIYNLNNASSVYPYYTRTLGKFAFRYTDANSVIHNVELLNYATGLLSEPIPTSKLSSVVCYNYYNSNSSYVAMSNTVEAIFFNNKAIAASTINVSLTMDSKRPVCVAANISLDISRTLVQDIVLISDVKKVVYSNITTNIDLKRAVEISQSISIDIIRLTTISEYFNSDLYRNVEISTELVLDSKKVVLIEKTISSDAIRSVLKNAVDSLDVERRIAANESISLDSIKNIEINHGIYIDTDKNVTANDTVVLDTIKSTVIESEINVDTLRIAQPIVHLNLDTNKTTFKSILLSLDSKKEINTTEDISLDSKRKIAVSDNIVTDTYRSINLKSNITLDIKKEVQKTITSSYDLKKKVTAAKQITYDTSKTIKHIQNSVAFQVMNTTNSSTSSTATSTYNLLQSVCGFSVKEITFYVSANASTNGTPSVTINGTTFNGTGMFTYANTSADLLMSSKTPPKTSSIATDTNVIVSVYKLVTDKKVLLNYNATATKITIPYDCVINKATQYLAAKTSVLVNNVAKTLPCVVKAGDIVSASPLAGSILYLQEDVVKPMTLICDTERTVISKFVDIPVNINLDINKQVIANEECNYDLNRKLAAKEITSLDTQKVIRTEIDNLPIDTKRCITTENPQVIFLDTKKIVYSNLQASMDTDRKISTTSITDYDMAKQTAIEVNINLDTNKEITSQNIVHLAVDMDRKVVTKENISIDTNKVSSFTSDITLDALKGTSVTDGIQLDTIKSAQSNFGLPLDVSRGIYKNAESVLDINRTTALPVAQNLDSSRTIAVLDVLRLDTERLFNKAINLNLDTKKKVIADKSFNLDTVRKVAYINKTTGFSLDGFNSDTLNYLESTTTLSNATYGFKFKTIKFTVTSDYNKSGYTPSITINGTVFNGLGTFTYTNTANDLVVKIKTPPTSNSSYASGVYMNFIEMTTDKTMLLKYDGSQMPKITMTQNCNINKATLNTGNSFTKILVNNVSKNLPCAVKVGDIVTVSATPAWAGDTLFLQYGYTNLVTLNLDISIEKAINVSLNLDSQREIGVQINPKLDTSKEIRINNRSSFDTIRKLACTILTSFDQVSLIVSESKMSLDTFREIVNHYVVHSSLDTFRSVQKYVEPKYDVLRKTTINNEIIVDSLRKVWQRDYFVLDTNKVKIASSKVKLDTSRKVNGEVITNYDLKRKVAANVNTSIDTLKVIGINTIYLLNTERTVNVHPLLHLDTYIQVIKSVEEYKDVVREISVNVDISMDAFKEVQSNAGKIILDTSKLIQKDMNIVFDTKRAIFMNSSNLYPTLEINYIYEFGELEYVSSFDSNMLIYEAVPKAEVIDMTITDRCKEFIFTVTQK